MSAELREPNAPEVNLAQRIQEATDRLIAGQPKRVKVGRLSVSALAKEAEVARATLYRNPYNDLRERFEARVQLAASNTNPENPLLRLEAKLEIADETIAGLKEALKEQHTLAEGLAQELAWVWDRWKEAEKRAENGGNPPETGVIPLRGRR